MKINRPRKFLFAHSHDTAFNDTLIYHLLRQKMETQPGFSISIEFVQQSKLFHSISSRLVKVGITKTSWDPSLFIKCRSGFISPPDQKYGLFFCFSSPALITPGYSTHRRLQTSGKKVEFEIAVFSPVSNLQYCRVQNKTEILVCV